MGNESFSQRLAEDPKKVQKVFDALGLPWRDHKPNPDGWVDIPNVGEFESDLGLHIYSGGWKDHFSYGYEKANGYELSLSSGDIVDLVTHLEFKSIPTPENSSMSIAWIKELLGMKAEPPELDPDREFVKNAIDQKEVNYAMVPKSILRANEIEASSKIIWAAIQERCGQYRNYAFPSINKLCEDTGLSRSTVQRGLKELRKKRYLAEASNGKCRAPKRYPLVRVRNP